MASDPALVARIASIVDPLEGFSQRRMFGGIAFFLNGNMCTGVHNEWLILRVGREVADRMLDLDGIKPMDITGKPMKGWVKVAPQRIESDNDLEYFLIEAAKFVETLPEK